MLLLLLGTGWAIKVVAGRLKTEWVEKTINVFVRLLYSLFFPIMFFNIFAERGLNLADASITILVLFYVALSLGILHTITRGLEPRVRNAVITTCIFPNVVFLGFPVLMALYGDITYASLYSLVMLVLNISVGGLLGVRRRGIIKAIIHLPILYGFIVGVIAHYTVEYMVIESMLAYTKGPVSIISTYGAAIVMGYSIPTTTMAVRRQLGLIGLQALYRFMVSPTLHILLSMLFILPLEACKQVLVESMMPPALTNTILARVHGWDHEYTAASTLTTTLTSLGIIPLLAAIGVI